MDADKTNRLHEIDNRWRQRMKDILSHFELPHRHHSEVKKDLFGRENNNSFQTDFDNNHHLLTDYMLEEENEIEKRGEFHVYRYDWKDIEFHY